MAAKWTRAKTIAATLLLATSLTARAVPADPAVTAIEAERFDDAFRSLKAATAPNARQSALLCYLYVRGYVAYDAADANTSCTAAVAAKDPLGLYVAGIAQSRERPPAGFQHDMQLALGRMAAAVKLDYYPAYDWLCQHFFDDGKYTESSPFCKVAAVNHRPASAYYLGLMLYNGNGAVQDFKKARQFLLASAQMNYAPAYKLLGDLSREGKWGTPKDLTQAYAWYALASSSAPDWQEPGQARNALDLNADGVSAAQKLAAGWVTQAPPSLF